MAAHALLRTAGAVLDQRVEGARMARQQPGVVLGLVTRYAELVAAVARRVQEHRNRLTRELREPHPHERGIAIVPPSLYPRGDATLRVDQEDHRDPGDPAVGGANRLVRVEEHGEEVEPVTRELGPYLGGPVLQRYADDDGARVLGNLGEGLPDGAQRAVTVGAGVQEEDQHGRRAAQRGQLERLVAVQANRLEVRRQRSFAQYRLHRAARHGQSKRLSDPRLDDRGGVARVDWHPASREGQVALGVHAHQRDGGAQSERARDRPARVIEDHEIEAM